MMRRGRVWRLQPFRGRHRTGVILEKAQKILLTPFDSNVEAAPAVAARAAKNYCNALRDLAK